MFTVALFTVAIQGDGAGRLPARRRRGFILRSTYTYIYAYLCMYAYIYAYICMYSTLEDSVDLLPSALFTRSQSQYKEMVLGVYQRGVGVGLSEIYTYICMYTYR